MQKRQTYGHTGQHTLVQVEAQMGRHARRLYPVETAYAFPKTAFHLTESVSKNLEASIVHLPPNNFKVSQVAPELVDRTSTTMASQIFRIVSQILLFSQ